MSLEIANLHKKFIYNGSETRCNKLFYLFVIKPRESGKHEVFCVAEDNEAFTRAIDTGKYINHSVYYSASLPIFTQFSKVFSCSFNPC